MAGTAKRAAKATRPAKTVPLSLTAELAARLVSNRSLRAGDVKAFLPIEVRQAATGR
jgi:hypothetical protein